MAPQALAASMSGIAATAVDVGLLMLLHRHGLAIAPATFIAATVGAATSYLLNKHVAFRDASRVTAHQLARFASVAIATALLMAAAMQVVAVEMHVPYVLAKLLCAATIFVAWTYPAQRRLVFRSSPLAATSI